MTEFGGEVHPTLVRVVATRLTATMAGWRLRQIASGKLRRPLSGGAAHWFDRALATLHDLELITTPTGGAPSCTARGVQVVGLIGGPA